MPWQVKLWTTLIVLGTFLIWCTQFVGRIDEPVMHTTAGLWLFWTGYGILMAGVLFMVGCMFWIDW